MLHTLRRSRKLSGFSLVELLVVIGLIAMLASIAMIALGTARAKAKEGKTRAGLKAISDAVNLLVDDTGKWPGGCPAESVGATDGTDSDNSSLVSMDLNDAQAGLATAPTVGTNVDDPTCSWSAADVARWNGPYLTELTDTYNHAYYFEPGHVANGHCDTSSDVGAPNAAVLSFGPDNLHATGTTDDCDAIYHGLQ